ncbi:polysaccharide deacetylase family protein [Lacinutrix iliipiscaria]|uniref:Polysaccharide deacetylase family protein n=1 Tax=Lacinutrix iliipiscaria TaxID=1230532 RepID=A0ABW5WML3_9FLAO
MKPGKRFFFSSIKFLQLDALLRFLKQRNKVTILLLHDPSPDNFDALLKTLTKKYNFISLKDYLEHRANRSLSTLPHYTAILTFDDGHKENYKLLPIFKKYSIPATIFLCSSLVNSNKHFWSNYNIPKQELQKIKKMPYDDMLLYLKTLGYIKDKEYEERHALNLSEIQEMLASKLIDFQAHTMYHPILINLNESDSKREIECSKKELENLLGNDIYAFAYPNGDYSNREINFVKKSGYQCAVTVDYGYNDDKTDLFRLKRISLNDTGSVQENIIKATGFWRFIKKQSYGYNEI